MLAFTQETTSLLKGIIIDWECKILMCSNYTVICGDALNIFISYKYYNDFSYNTSISSDFLSSNSTFTDYYIYQETLLGVIINYNLLQVYDIEILIHLESEIEETNGLIYSQFLSYSANMIMASYDQIYIIANNYVSVYNTEIKFIKVLLLDEFFSISNAYLIHDILVIIANEDLIVINGSDIISNSIIYTQFIEDYQSVFLIGSSTNSSIYILADKIISQLFIPSQYNEVSFEFNIIRPTEISSINYTVIMNLTVTNQYNTDYVLITIILILNGQTIY